MGINQETGEQNRWGDCFVCLGVLGFFPNGKWKSFESFGFFFRL